MARAPKPRVSVDQAMASVKILVTAIRLKGLRWKGTVKLGSPDGGVLSTFLGKTSLSFDTTFTIPK
jgi:hypothetical protein